MPWHTGDYALDQIYPNYKACPRLGDIVVYSRGSNPASGHVNFFLDQSTLNVYGVGGNQGDRVSVNGMPRALVLGYRRPA